MLIEYLFDSRPLPLSRRLRWWAADHLDNAADALAALARRLDGCPF